MSEFEIMLYFRARIYTSVALCWIALRLHDIGLALVDVAKRVEGDL